MQSATPDATRRQAAAPVRNAAVRVDGVARYFDGEDGPVAALSRIDLALEPGRFTVIVGPSGCGKTTLLRLLAGLDQPSTGTVSITRSDGGVPTNAVVFQGRSVFPWLRVEDNIGYGLRLRGIDRQTREATVSRLLEMVGLERFRRSYPHQLSEGMRQRVAIARALAVDPDLLLMDEPFGSLDEHTRLLLQNELLRIWEQSGMSVVFVTHSIDEALALADEVIVMSARPGRIRQRIAIPFGRPRTVEAVRSDPRFARLFAEIWALIRDEVAWSRAGADAQ